MKAVLKWFKQFGEALWLLVENSALRAERDRLKEEAVFWRDVIDAEEAAYEKAKERRQ